MAPKSKPVPADAPAPAPQPQPEPEIIEEIVPEPTQAAGPSVTFVLDGEAAQEEIMGEEDGEYYEDDEGEEDFDVEDDALTTAVGQLTQLMMTEAGEAITDVLSGIREALDKQNKIMYRGLQLLEARFAKK